MFMLRKEFMENVPEGVHIQEILCLVCFENSKNPETIQYPYNAVKSFHALDLLMKKHVEKPCPERH
jgi:hypothetical protein